VSLLCFVVIGVILLVETYSYFFSPTVWTSMHTTSLPLFSLLLLCAFLALFTFTVTYLSFCFFAFSFAPGFDSGFR
jgi:hypothetical protein